MDKWLEPSVLATLVVGAAQCIIAAWLGAVAIRTLRATEQAARAAETSAIVATESLRIAERAWLGFEGPGAEVSVTGDPQIYRLIGSLAIVNKGSSPGFVTTSNYGFYYGEVPPYEVFVKQARDDSCVVYPGDRVHVKGLGPRDMKDDSLFYLLAHVGYRDIFGVEHELCQAFQWDWESRTFVIVNSPEYAKHNT